MSLYRCANCGSPNVIVDTQVGGTKYDYKKGALGTLLLGPGGAVAGISNSKEQVFRCPDCGMTLTYPMPEEIKQAIDLGVMSADARKQTFVGNSLFTWEYLSQTYKNIESGFADRQIAQDAKWGKEYREEMKEVIARGEAQYPKYSHFLSTTCRTRFGAFPDRYDAVRYIVYYFADLSGCEWPFGDIKFFLSLALPELREGAVNNLFGYLFIQGILDSNKKSFIKEDTLFWIDDNWYEGIPSRTERYKTEKNSQGVASDVETSVKKAGQIGDRPYARGRSFDPSHYGE